MSLIDPLTGIPSYINEPIDILADSAMQVCEKIGYKAHDKTYVEALWDASPSTLVSKLPSRVDWRPLELRMDGHSLKDSYDSEVSDVPEYCLSSGNHPFFGYESEPPIAPAFREAKPASLATPALESLGRLHALLKLENRADEIVELDLFFTQMWGVQISDLTGMSNLEPEITNRSKIDLVKGVRNKTHRIYGYENEQNYVTVSGGNYTRSGLNDSRYIDWHRINLVLRFIGVNLMVSDEFGRRVLRDKSLVLQYGLVASEFPLVVNAPNLPSLKGINVEPPSIEISNAFAYAMAFYSSERVVNALADRNRLASEKVKLREDFKISDITLAIVKESLNKKRKVGQFEIKSSRIVDYDILKPDGSSSKKTLEGKLSQLDIHHNMSMMRAVELVLLSKLIILWKTPQAVVIRDIMDSLRRDATLNEDKRRKVTSQIANLFTRYSGGIIWRVLKKFTASNSAAELEFTKFCLEMQFDEVLTDIPSKSEFFWRCSHSSSAYKVLTAVFRRTFTKLVHFFNVPKLPERFNVVTPDAESEFTTILHHLWKDKVSYWVGHYNQRRIQWTRTLSEQEKPSRQDKGKLIRYQWLVKWLPKFYAEVTAELEIWPHLDNKEALALSQSTIHSFTRKRKTHPDDAYANEQYKNYLRRVDAELKPPFSFLKLAENVYDTAKEMSRDIAKVYKNMNEPDPMFAYNDPLGDTWRKALADAMVVQEDWSNYLESSGTEADWTLILDLEEPALVSNLASEAIQEKLASSAIMSMSSVLRSDGRQNIDPSIARLDIVEEVVAMEKIRENIPASKMYEQESVDLSVKDVAPAKPKMDLKALRTRMKGKSLTLDASLSSTVLTKRSPLSEMTEKLGKVPNLLKWAEAAKVSVAQLEACQKSDFNAIYEAGRKLLIEDTAHEGTETYDIA